MEGDDYWDAYGEWMAEELPLAAGRARQVKKLNYKEMGASIACVVLGVVLGAILTFSLSYVVDTPFQAPHGQTRSLSELHFHQLHFQELINVVLN